MQTAISQLPGICRVALGETWLDTTMDATNDDVSSLPVDACEQGITEEEDKLVAKMETIIQFFLDCLQVTGGDLAPSKCTWYLISHHWKDGIPRLL
jgi:hypothetical protein